MTRSNATARTILTLCCWIILGLVIASAIATAPGIESASHDAALNAPTGIVWKVVLAIGTVAVIGAWASALWHAGTNTTFRSDGQKVLLLLLLLLGNCVAAFFYCFTYVVWQPKTSATTT